MTTCYLEVDDEITTAIGRIRAVRDGEAVIVVPPGSRIATSRINFKLLAREATERRLNMVAVSDEPQVRALAISAGLPAYDSIVAAEQALAGFREQDRKLAERLGRQPLEEPSDNPSAADRGAADGDTGTKVLGSGTLEAAEIEAARSKKAAASPSGNTATAGMATETATGTGGVTAASVRARAAAARRRRRRRRVGVTPIVMAAVLLVLLAAVGYGAYLFLPTASIALHPRATYLRPEPVAVVADPNVAVADVAAGVVPAEVVEVPLRVAADFPATGVEVRETRASGIARFRSENTISDVPVAEGTVVSTSDGIDFATTALATVPRADFATTTPGTVDVEIRAARTGTRGNVAADTITKVPAGLAGQLVSVRNPNATDGGRRVEENVVTQADFDSALIALDGPLEAALAEVLSRPETTPRGLTLFFTSAQTGDAQPVPAALDLVGAVQPTFTLALESVATVSAVNEQLVDDLAAERLRAGLPPGQQIVGDEVETTHSVGEVVGTTIVYTVQASASVYGEPDQAGMISQVRGKTVTEAKQLLSRYGVVDIAIWPDFVDRLPDQAARISVTILAPGPGSSPAPGSSPISRPSSGPSAGPGASPTASPSA